MIEYIGVVFGCRVYVAGEDLVRGIALAVPDSPRKVVGNGFVMLSEGA